MGGKSGLTKFAAEDAVTLERKDNMQAVAEECFIGTDLLRMLQVVN